MKKRRIAMLVMMVLFVFSCWGGRSVFAEPAVPGCTVETYVNNITLPQKLTFDGELDGFLYVGNGVNTGVSIHRISLIDQSLSSYEPPLKDPDAVIYDGDGTVSGTPGSIIVGGGVPVVSPYIIKILPDETIEPIWESGIPLNLGDMIFDSTGCLLLTDGAGREVLHACNSNDPEVLFSMSTDPLSIAVNCNDVVFVSDTSGAIKKYENNVLSDFVTGISTGIVPICFGPSGSVWANELYAIANASLLRFDSDGNQMIIGTGFDGSYTDIDFGPDNALYISDYNGNQILRIVPEPVEVEMVLIPGGEFEMGDHHDGMTDALPVHTVYVDSFYMGKYEVTNQQYCDYLNSALSQDLIEVRSGVVYAAPGGTDPYCDTTTSSSYSRITWNGSSFGVVFGKEDHPMVMVSWYGCIAYCDYYGYRLPTEAEWEYAARGGKHDPYYRFPWGDSIDDSMANYSTTGGDPYETGAYPWTTPLGYYDGGQIPTGTDMANGYGLYDVAGNVWEWCNDWYDSSYYSTSPASNPTGPASGSYHVIRGGFWYHLGDYCRVANRNYYPGDRYNGIGFRVARDAEPAGPVAYWSFDDPCSLGHDDSGNGHDGVVHGAGSVDAVCGNALDFDGIGDWVACPDVLSGLSQGTVMAHFYVDEDDVTGNHIISKGTNALTDFVIGRHHDGIIHVHIGNGFLTSNTAVPLKTWAAVAVTWDGSHVKIYIDGVLDKDEAISAAPYNNDNIVKLGTHSHSSNPYYDGKIDEVRIYDRALSESEIQELAKACGPEPAICLSVEAFIPGIEVQSGLRRITGLSLSPDETKLYAAYWADTSSDPIAVYSTEDYSLLNTMSYGRCHGGVAVSYDGRYIYTPSYYQGNVSCFDTQNGYARETIYIGSWANVISITPDRTKVVATYNAPSPSVKNSLAVINIADGAFELAKVVSLDHPGANGQNIAFSADSNYGYITTYRSDTEGPALLEVSLSVNDSSEVTRSCEFAGNYLAGCVMVGNSIFVGSKDENKIYIVDEESFAQTGEISLDLSPGGIYLHPDGQHLFVLSPFQPISNDGAISVIDINSNSIVDSISNLHGAPRHIVFTKDGRKAYVAHYQNEGGITILDICEPANTTPLADAGEDQTVPTGPDGEAEVVLDCSDSNDVDGDELSYTWYLDGEEIATGVNPTIVLPCGTYTIELIVNDGKEDSEPDYVDVTVQDGTGPEITCPVDITLECPADTDPCTTGFATADDNCDEQPEATYYDAISGICPKIIERTWVATDAAGNESSCPQTITIVDSTPPVITGVPADVTVECDSVPLPANPTATDNCDTDVPVSFEETRTDGDCTDSYTLTRTWTAVDNCGNTTVETQIITVVDTTSPVISDLDADYLLAEIGQTVNFSAGVFDNCDNDVGIMWNFGDGTEPSPNPSHEYTQAGIYTVTVTATDACGNLATDSIIIVVYDPTAGFTSGGGWFVPDSDSHIDGEPVTDNVSKANFGFIVKYKKGADNPDGNLEFQYKAGDIDLKSSDMDWLVVQSATKVRFKGLATINGEGEYTFKVTAEDNGEPGTGDWFKIEIWLGPDVDTENGSQTPKHKAQGYLGGGNIQIHQK